MSLNSKNGNRKEARETKKNRRGTLPEKARSFHGRGTTPQRNPNELRRHNTLPELFSNGHQTFVGTTPQRNPNELRRPKTVPELFSNGHQTFVGPVASIPPLTKLLFKVTVQGSLDAVKIVISQESTVNDLIDAAIRLYVKEVRRPVLPESEPSRFHLHYSQFSLERIGRDQKLMSLGSRNFFLHIGGGSSESCSKEAEKVAKTGFHWLNFIGF